MSTTVNTTILLIYILIYIIFIFCLLKNPWKSWWWWCVSNQSGTNLRICPRPCWIQWLKKIIYVLPKVFEKNGPKQYVRGVSPPFIGGLYIIGPAVGTVGIEIQRNSRYHNTKTRSTMGKSCLELVTISGIPIFVFMWFYY